MQRTVALSLALAVSVAGCGDAEMDELPETAEVETEPMETEVETEAMETEVETEAMGDELELEEELVLGMDDVGETIMATGWVSGIPLENGFFLRTEAARVIFVETDASVTAGDAVRVTGPLVATETAVFEGWETDAFDAGFEAEWDVETTLYIDATSVEQMEPM